MKMIRILHSLLLLAFGAALAELPNQASEKIHVLVVTGGHAFQTNQFFRLFRENTEIRFRSVAHPNAQEWFKPDAVREYDTIVFYDMWQEISDEARANFTASLREGTGLVALHHCLASYQKWPEFAKIIGGKYYLETYSRDGVKRPASTYRHDVKIHVQVADSQHPVTRGLSDFEIQDETYGLFEVNPDIHPLLTTKEPTSGSPIAWAKRHGKARVVYIQLGHDHLAFESPNYQRLLAQAIRWTAKRNPISP